LQVPLTVSDRPRFSGDGRWLAAALNGERAQLLEVTPSREHRTLVSSLGAGQGAYNWGDISPDGRLLALGMDEGARLWDLRGGREVAALPAGTIYVSFEGGGEAAGPTSRPRALLTAGPAGLLRWPLTTDDPEGKHLRLGPPQHLSPLPRAWFTRAPDGRTLAVATREGWANHVLDLETGEVRREVGPHPAGEVRALSGDGRWAASSGWHSDRVRLWDVGTGKMVNEWAVGKRTYVYFTPDSRALVIARDGEFSFWDVATLQPIRRLARDVAQFPGHVAFSPDGQLMALEMAPGVLHLKEAASGRTVARLEGPHGDRATWQGFTPDGTQLVVVSTFARAIHIWDLQAIRARLKDMNLDWDGPELAPAGGPGPSPGNVLKVSIVGAELLAEWAACRDRAVALSQAGQWEEAIAQYSRAIDLMPDDPYCRHQRGDLQRHLGRWHKALADYARAAELRPTNRVYCALHGYACAQVGQWEKAAAAFEHVTTLKPDDVLNWYHLALVKLQLGDRAGYRKACAGMLDRCDRSADENDAYWAVRACALAPDAVADWTRPLRLAEKAQAVHAKNRQKTEVLAAVLYRAGRFKEADRLLTEAEAWAKPTPSARRHCVFTWLFQAMTQHRLGQAPDAASCLEKAVKAIDQQYSIPFEEQVKIDWAWRLESRLLAREAEELLARKGP
jgi:tetratricopeptide (TPR) repeat protein